MLRTALIILSLTLSLTCLAFGKKDKVQIQPEFWWSGMKQPTLQIMLHAPGIGLREVSVKAEGIRVDSVHRPTNTNYLFIYLNVAQARPQTFDIALCGAGGTRHLSYELRARDNAVRAQGFDASDVVYLLMPDRFVNGDERNDVVPGLKDALHDGSPDARHGGDLAGMRRALPYLSDLGVTAVWPTPLLVNDMPSHSYHGYAITDYYRTDPRYGSNDDYRAFVSEAHERGMKVMQDMVFNHCGSENFLFTDLPDSTWFNHRSRYVQTSYKIASVGDVHAAAVDRDNATDGWFVSSMPDLNQRNPHVLRYLIQNSVWWIEYAGIDGIRQDTYPYADRRAMAQWCREVLSEYPSFNIVGETWLGSNAGVSYWQKDSPLAARGDNSQLPTVMDFPLMSLLNSALDEETNDWDRGLARIYDYLSQDAVYADPSHLLTFLDNHDTDRFARNEAQAALTARYRQALTLLLTLRGIPQLYYGDELAMAADKSRGDGALRRNFPGGFSGDTVSALTGRGLSPLSTQTLALTRRLLRWRRGNDVVSRGEFIHFAVRNGAYVYARRLNGKTVTVVLNGTDTERTLALAPYAEVLPSATATDVVTGLPVDLGRGELPLPARATMILEF